MTDAKSDIKSQAWYQLFASAMLELDPARFRELAEAAETAMSDRLQELQPSSDHQEERKMIADARQKLATLRRNS
jgi:hypothetical protein